MSGVRVYPENMLANMSKSQDTIFSGSLLLSLVDKGLKREDAYALTQKAAFIAREKKIGLEKAVIEVPEITKHLSAKDMKKAFNVKTHFKNIPHIYKRAFKK